MQTAKTLFICICIFLFYASAYSASFTVCTAGCDYSTIQSAVNHASNGDNISVFPGTYYENIFVNNKSINLTSLYGPQSTILHGNNSGSVVAFTADILPNYSSIEGFTITGGTGRILSGKYYPSFPSYSKGGGGIFIYYAAPKITNCIICNNSLTGDLLDLGSAIFIYAGTGSEYGDNTIISNCIISDNIAVGIPSGSSTVYSQYSSPLIINCTIVNNSPIAIQAYDSSSSPVIKNTNLWNNGDDINGIPYSMISYSNIQDGDFKGTNGNISQDPLFIGAGSYHLQSNSPCIDSGTSDGAPETDLNGNPRYDVLEVPNSGGGSLPYYDMGAYEYQPSTLIELSLFTVIPKSKAVILVWSTASEIDTAGFKIYRAESKNGYYININSEIIPAKGSSAQGAVYEFTDANVTNRKTYWYKLEDIDLNGMSTLHGPVTATPWLLFKFFK